jgi:hypothetical protein
MSIKTLTEAELTEARAKAFQLEANAYATSKDVYGESLPTERRQQPANL